MISEKLSILLDQEHALSPKQLKFLAKVTATADPNNIQDASFVARSNILMEQMPAHNNAVLGWALNFCRNRSSAAELVMVLDKLNLALTNPLPNPLEPKWRELRNSSLR